MKRMGVYCVSTRAIHLDAICGMTDGHMDRQKKTDRRQTDRQRGRTWSMGNYLIMLNVNPLVHLRCTDSPVDRQGYRQAGR